MEKQKETRNVVLTYDVETTLFAGNANSKVKGTIALDFVNVPIEDVYELAGKQVRTHVFQSKIRVGFNDSPLIRKEKEAMQEDFKSCIANGRPYRVDVQQLLGTSYRGRSISVASIELLTDEQQEMLVKTLFSKLGKEKIEAMLKA